MTIDRCLELPDTALVYDAARTLVNGTTLPRFSIAPCNNSRNKRNLKIDCRWKVQSKYIASVAPALL